MLVFHITLLENMSISYYCAIKYEYVLVFTVCVHHGPEIGPEWTITFGPFSGPILDLRWAHDGPIVYSCC